MTRSERASAITQLLVTNPNKDFPLGTFASMFGCAKSSISDDIKIVKNAAEELGLGYIETTSGSKGGVRFVPYPSKNAVISILEKFKDAICEKDRVIGSGFIYTSDIMYNPEYVKAAAMVFAKKFAALDADVVVTIETKGIGVAMMTANMLNLPLVVIRREARVSDGSTISINYFSGSTDRIQKMSLAKRAIAPGSKAIIIDDFMRGGGSIKGIQDMLGEFDASSVGTGVVIVSGLGNKKIGDYFPLFILDEGEGENRITINPDIAI